MKIRDERGNTIIYLVGVVVVVLIIAWVLLQVLDGVDDEVQDKGLASQHTAVSLA